MVRIVDLVGGNPYHSHGGGEIVIYNTNKWLLKKGFEIITVCFADKDFVIEKTEMGKIIGIKVPRNELLRIITYSIKGSRLVKRLNPDILIGEGGGNMGAGILAALTRRKGTVYIARSHGTHMQLILSMTRKNLHMRILGRLMAEIIERYSYTLADYIIAVSRSTKKELIKHYRIRREKIRVIHNGVDTEKYRPLAKGKRAALRRRLGFRDGATQILYIGLDPFRKGLDVAVRAVDLLGENAVLNVIGTTKEEGRRFVRDEGIDEGVFDRINFVGRVDDDEKIRYYQASDLFLFPSRYESIALVALEALSCGLPAVISGRVPAYELAGPGEGLFVVPGFDPKDYADKICGIISKVHKTDALSARARKSMLKYDWRLVSERYYRAISEVIRRGD